MKKLLTFVSIWALFTTFLITLAPQQASAATTLTTCTSLKTGYQLISKTGKCNEQIYESTTWYQNKRVPLGTPGSKRISINTCQSKTRAELILLRAKCNPKTQITTTWHRPLGPPDAPSIVTITVGLSGTATVATKAPTDNGGARITSYTLSADPPGSDEKTVRVNSNYKVTASGIFKIEGLNPGSTYTFTLIAHNAVGTSAPSQASAPFLAPTVAASPAITLVVATGTSSALITFAAPIFDGGLPVTSYTATSFPGGVQSTAYGSSSGIIDMSGLAPSTNYTFTIVANNFAGSSLPSTVSASITTLTPRPRAPAPSVEAPHPTVAKFLPTFSPWANLSKPALAGDFILTAPVVTGLLAGALAYSSDSTGVITISGSTAHVLAEGTSVITATFTPTNTAAYSSATTTMTITVTAGDYTVGMDGPGGGKVFYVSASPFLCGPTQTAYCKFLESAATTGSGAWTDNWFQWSGNTSDWIGTTTTAIGGGYKNTLAMIAQSNTASKAGTIAQAFTGGGLSDWYLPSTDELNQMCKWAFGNSWTSDATLCSGGTLNLGTGAGLGAAGFIEYYYWSSSELSVDLPQSARDHDFNKTGLKDYGWKDSYEIVRPIRAFASRLPKFTLSSSSETRNINNVATGFTILSTGGAIANFAISATPAGMSFNLATGALTGTPTTVAAATAYTVTATNASGSATQTFTLTVDMASQTTLSITSLTTNTKAYPYSQAVSITTSGGSGSGATTYEIASGGSASGCTLTGPTATETITATTSGTCLIQASKAADSIYSLATSATSIFTFTKATPTLSNSIDWFDGLMKNYNDIPFDVGTPTVANDLAGTFTFTSLNIAIATISGRRVTIVSGGGHAAIQATFTPTDTANYLSGRFIRMNIYVTANLSDG